MGAAKEALIEREEQYEAAKRFLVRAGTLQVCEAHGSVFEGDGDLDGLWRIAASELKKREKGRAAWAGDMPQREFTDLLNAVYQDNCGESCWGCDKNDRE